MHYTFTKKRKSTASRDITKLFAFICCLTVVLLVVNTRIYEDRIAKMEHTTPELATKDIQLRVSVVK